MVMSVVDPLLDRPPFGRLRPRDQPDASGAPASEPRGCVDAITSVLRQRIGPPRIVRIGHLWLTFRSF
jgi:hypothetical protein